MSIEAMVGALNHSKAHGAAHIVLLNIANHQGEQGAWPSIPTLARLSKLTDRRVQQIIVELVELGELIVENRAAGYGSIKTNRYWVTINCPPTCDGTFAHREVKPISDRGEVGFTAGVKPVSFGGEVGFTQTNIEPTNEPTVKRSNSKSKKTIQGDWKPSPDLISVFADKWPSLKFNIELEAFVNYHLARDSKMANWDAAFRNWCANAVKWAEEKKPKTSVDYNKIKGYK